MFEMSAPGFSSDQKPELKEIMVSVMDNGFVVYLRGVGISKQFVIQSESEGPHEIEEVLDVIRTVYHQVKKAKAEEQPEEARPLPIC